MNRTARQRPRWRPWSLIAGQPARQVARRGKLAANFVQWSIRSERWLAATRATERLPPVDSRPGSPVPVESSSGRERPAAPTARRRGRRPRVGLASATRPSQPAGGAGPTEPGLPDLHRASVRTVGVGITDPLNDRQVARLPEGVQILERGVQADVVVELEDLVGLDAQGRAALVIDVVWRGGRRCSSRRCRRSARRRPGSSRRPAARQRGRGLEPKARHPPTQRYDSRPQAERGRLNEKIAT